MMLTSHLFNDDLWASRSRANEKPPTNREIHRGFLVVSPGCFAYLAATVINGGKAVPQPGEGGTNDCETFSVTDVVEVTTGVTLTTGVVVVCVVTVSVTGAHTVVVHVGTTLYWQVATVYGWYAQVL